MSHLKHFRRQGLSPRTRPYRRPPSPIREQPKGGKTELKVSALTQLTLNRLAVEALAEALLARRELSGPEATAIIRSGLDDRVDDRAALIPDDG